MPTPSPVLDSISETLELQDYLSSFKAKLIKAQGQVFLSLSGKLVTSKAAIPYALVPSNGTLAKLLKWGKYSNKERLALVKERIHAEAVQDAENELEQFVMKATLLAERYGVKVAPFWSGLIAPTELASKRFRIIESRIEVAGIKAKEQANAETTKATSSLSLYPESFPIASRMTRKFIAILGPTNSGKTYQALQALSTAANGVYLAPLRLLALENFEKLEENQVKVSLITGEERRLCVGATHTASTIEMLDLQTQVDCGVIDEIQMIDDRDRGSAWTAAVCGLPAKEIYLVGSVSAKAAIEALVARLGCELEIRILTRMSPLVVEPKAVNSIKELKKGDALIAFSRKEVLSWRDQLQSSGLSVAVIYGSLSPEVRRAQAKRFRDGEVDVLVATDAVGMGLNLPISRIVFTTSTKFDGIDEDTLPVWLAQQIGGRAGRYGLHEEGSVAGWGERTHAVIRKLMAAKLDAQPVRGFLVAPCLDTLAKISGNTGEKKLEKLLNLFNQHIDVHDEFFLPADMQEQKDRSKWLDNLPLSLENKFLLSCVPVSTKVVSLNQAWESWARSIAINKKSRMGLEVYDRSRNALLEAEDACKKYSAYAWLSYRLPALFPDGDAAVELARHTSRQIDKMLQSKNGRPVASKPIKSNPHRKDFTTKKRT